MLTSSLDLVVAFRFYRLPVCLLPVCCLTPACLPIYVFVCFYVCINIVNEGFCVPRAVPEVGDFET